jgi:hypothetical protein
MTTDEFALSLLPRELAAYTGRPTPSYRDLYMRVVDGRLPAHQTNGRWFIRRTDLPVIAEATGLASAPAIRTGTGVPGAQSAAVAA